jgi:hypothetical protein
MQLLLYLRGDRGDIGNTKKRAIGECGRNEVGTSLIMIV